MALYETDADSPWGVGIPVTTQSMIKTFRTCHREAFYKYFLRLQPKSLGLALTRGKWVHALLEAYYAALATTPGDEDAAQREWKVEHQRWTSRFNKLFDEEKEKLGDDLPRDIVRLMESYFWHYGDMAFEGYRWKVHEVELTLEALLPNGHLFRGRIDLLVEDDYGLWIVDHKTHKKLPDWNVRMFDEQSPPYIWAARKMGIPVRGFMWNYLSTAGISVPKVLQNGNRFYAKTGDSDYPTYARAVKAAMAEHPTFLGKTDDKEAVRQELARLKAQRWQPNAIPTSPHFRRDVIEKADGMIDRVIAAMVRTSDTMHSYDFSDRDAIERTTNTCQKGFLCSYQSLSLTDLIKGDSTMVEQREYQHGDPLGYYDGNDEGMR